MNEKLEGVDGLGGLGAGGLSEALARGIFAADELKRRASLDRGREDAAAEGLRTAYQVLGGRALEELEGRENWPAPPDFGKLMDFLEACNDSARVFEGIERELAWCEGVLAGAGLDLEGLSREAGAVCEAYRSEMIAYAGRLLAEGEKVDEEAVPRFSAVLETYSKADAGQLHELLAEVRAAYAKYRRVIGDNGPFALHATAEMDDRAKIAEELERLRAANAKPYQGILDDDFMDHVNAFWEGFCKLGTVCERRADVNLAPVLSYFQRVADELARALRGKKLGDVDELALLNALPASEE